MGEFYIKEILSTTLYFQDGSFMDVEPFSLYPIEDFESTEYFPENSPHMEKSFIRKVWDEEARAFLRRKYGKII